jgi:hypothetical protein
MANDARPIYSKYFHDRGVKYAAVIILNPRHIGML